MKPAERAGYICEGQMSLFSDTSEKKTTAAGSFAPANNIKPAPAAEGAKIQMPEPGDFFLDPIPGIRRIKIAQMQPGQIYLICRGNEFVRWYEVGRYLGHNESGVYVFDTDHPQKLTIEPWEIGETDPFEYSFFEVTV